MSTIADPSVYKLQKQTDDPRFEGFGTAGAKSIRGRSFLTQDFLPDALTNWKPPRLSPIWKPLKVVGRVRESNDYPCVSLTIPAFSRKAVDALREFLTQNGELLPLVSEVGLFFAYNITTLVDAFDPEHSEADWINEWVAALIHRYEFFPDQLEGLTIFQFSARPRTAVRDRAVCGPGPRGRVAGDALQKSLAD